MEIDQASSGDRIIRFSELWAEAWAARWIVLSVTLLFTLAGVVAGLLIPKQYRAEILLTQADSPSGGGEGGTDSLASQYGMLASIAGVSLSGKGQREEAIAVLQSRLITEAYIRDNGLLPVLYPKLWNAEAKDWKVTDTKKIPTLWRAARDFDKKIRDVKTDKQTGLVTMRIDWKDPVAAARWANDLVRNTNQYMREKAIKELDQNMAYLNAEAAKTNVVEVRAAIFSILKNELNKEMIAKGRDEYALKVIDPAQSPELPSTPTTRMLTLVGFAVGLAISAIFVWGKSLFV